MKIILKLCSVILVLMIGYGCASPRGSLHIRTVGGSSDNPETVRSIRLLGRDEIASEYNGDSLFVHDVKLGKYVVEVEDLASRIHTQDKRLQQQRENVIIPIPPYPVRISLISKGKLSMIERARIKTTDHLGRIELFDYSAGSVLNLNSGSYSIEINADGYLPYPDQSSLPDSLRIPRNLSYTYELREDLQNFQFTVIDSLSREPLSNARISLDDYEFEYLVDELSYPEQNSIELAAMNYWIRVEADGYDPQKILYSKQPGRSVRIEIEMMQKTYELHSIVRDSQSNDIINNARIRAKTKLDGDYQRLDRPYRFHPGEYHLQISAPGYRSKTDKINIHEDMEKHYSLDRKSYEISFKTNIPARVFRDNQEVNPNTADYNDNLSPGTYIYRFAAEGYTVAEKRIEVTQEKINSQGSAEIVPVNLQKKTGVLKVNLLDTFNRQSVIGDIAVGENVRKGVTEAEFTLPWGEYRVSASAPGRESTGQIVTVIADETSSKSIFLSKSVISSGREVDLKTTPQWQELIIGIPYKGNRRDFRIEYVNREGQHKHKVENLNDNVPSKRLGDILSPAEVKPQSVIKILVYGG